MTEGRNYMQNFNINFLNNETEISKKILEHFNVAQEIANMGSWSYDILEDKYIFSDHIYIIFDTTPNELQCREDFLKFIHPDDLIHFKKKFTDFLTAKKEFEIEYRIIRRNGECRYIVGRAAFILDEIGYPQKVIGTLQDVTDRKKSQIKEEQYKSLFDYNPDPVYSLDLSGNFIEFNEALLQLVGYTREELLEKPFLDVLDSSFQQEAMNRFEGAKRGISQRYELVAIKKNGEKVFLLAVKFPIIVEEKVVGVYGIAKDITNEKSSQLRLVDAEAKFRSMVEDSIAAAYIIQDGIFIYGNPQAKNILGVTQMEGLPLAAVVHPDDIQRVNENTKRRLEDGVLQRYEARVLCGDGSIKHVEIHGSRTIINGKPSLLGTFIDITQRKITDKLNEHFAFHDHLTLLPNRRFMEKKLAEQIKLSYSDNNEFAVLYIDLDRFKFINDSLGHQIGDKLLQKAANRLRSFTRVEDFIARIAGDEFLILLPNVTEKMAFNLANKLVYEMEKPFTILQHKLQVTTSIGVSMYPKHGEDRSTLLHNADSALYRAKSAGKNSVYLYSPSATSNNLMQFELENELRTSINEKIDFVLHYQPKVTPTGSIVGGEALIRWCHPKYGYIPPSDFLPIVERMGLMKKLEAWVVETLCNDIKNLYKKGSQPKTISFNVSAQRLREIDFVQHLYHCITKAEISPETLEVEITETSYLENEPIVIETLKKLKEIGVKITLDDFGKGYSSLSYLKRFKGFINTLKIDRHFIQDLGLHEEDELILKTIIQLAHNMRIKVLVEGVETYKQLSILAHCNCDEVQGFLFSKPIPINKFEEHLNHGVICLEKNYVDLL